MKLNYTPIKWTLFFVITLVALALIANVYIEPREIIVNDTEARSIGRKIAEMGWLKKGRFNPLSKTCLATMWAKDLLSIHLPNLLVK